MFLSLVFSYLVINQGHYDFLRQHMEGERQLIIVGIKELDMRADVFSRGCRKFYLPISSRVIARWWL